MRVNRDGLVPGGAHLNRSWHKTLAVFPPPPYAPLSYSPSFKFSVLDSTSNFHYSLPGYTVSLPAGNGGVILPIFSNTRAPRAFHFVTDFLPLPSVAVSDQITQYYSVCPCNGVCCLTMLFIAKIIWHRWLKNGYDYWRNDFHGGGELKYLQRNLC